MTPDLSIVIPVYNEHTKIGEDIRQASDFLARHTHQGELLIVDDGSTDRTREAADKAPVPETVTKKVITLSSNQGKGHAVKTGILASQGMNVAFTDSGCCIPFNQLTRGLDLILNQRYTLAIGSRRHAQSIIHRDQSLKRRLFSRAFRCVINHTFASLSPLTDTQCGFKVYQGDRARDLFAHTCIEGFLFDIEIILLTQSRGHRVGEFPVEWTCDPDSRLSANRHTREILREIQQLKKRFGGMQQVNT